MRAQNSIDPIRKRVATAIRGPDPVAEFRSHRYVRHNQRRLEHLASLGLPLAGRLVLEVGAGIGDHTTFFLDRGCDVVITEGRGKNLEILRQRFPEHSVHKLDLDHPDHGLDLSAEIVYCYGTLYHLSQPEPAIAYLAERCDDLLLLETAVAPGEGVELHRVPELGHSLSQAIAATGCRPTRAWVRSRLERHFEHVYCTRTQPWHEEFPVDWTIEPPETDPIRSIFVASREPLDNPNLLNEIPTKQVRGP